VQFTAWSRDLQVTSDGTGVVSHVARRCCGCWPTLAVSRWIEERTGWSIRKFVQTARRYRTIEIQTGAHTITAADPLPDDLRDALNAINNSSHAH
jgi:hypothetical protein